MKSTNFKQPIRFTHQFKLFGAHQYKQKEINGYTVITNIEDTVTEANYAENLAICDVSFLPRIGIKNINAYPDVLEPITNIPNNVNSATDSNGCLVGKIGPQELLLINSINSSTDLQHNIVEKYFIKSAYNNGVYLVPRQDSQVCFIITGKQAPSLFAKICSIDLRKHKFNNLQITQTNIARISSIIIRNDINDILSFYLLVDQAYKAYFWDCINNAMVEYSGKAIGTNSLELLL